MNTSSFVFAAVLIAMAVSGTTASAREGGARMQIDFETLDANADGRVTQEEIAAHRTARLAAADINGDGLLSLDELQRRGSEKANARAARMLERLDADSDGKLSAAELSAAPRQARMFERLDTNADGAITQAEFDAARAKHQAQNSGAPAQ